MKENYRNGINMLVRSQGEKGRRRYDMNLLKNKNTSSIFSLLAKNIEDGFSGTMVSFSQELFNHIDAKGLKDVDVYTRAHIDRKLFSKIRKIGYLPSKKTIIALALALELNYSETIYLLNLAGYTLSLSDFIPFDIIITKAIESKMYNIDEINELLNSYELPLLGE